MSGIACELTVGEEVYLASEETPRRLGSGSNELEYFSVRPGDFAVLITFEYIYLPKDLMGFLSLRNSYKQRGLINVSGFHVDPGFHGRLVYTVYNAGPIDIVLRFRERIFMLTFGDVLGTADRYLFRDTKAQEFKNGSDQLSIPTSILGYLSGRSVSPRSLDERLRKLETIVNVLFIPLTTGLIIALISLLAAHPP
jgi:dCTP deaminase